ncbi:sialic acid-binding Ig-like lectin 13 isoform X2 [Desmodus rotundus]|uniref:sialic acid-binding Ig-like lectin 13 isoform X2 n=1 Tax=Desmodus rotundus TaxID=9430 RepID=UPI002380C990|nr:sialic acid-binding Ig-like lectin 13 isoform X2 [Desmodus rotundus]
MRKHVKLTRHCSSKARQYCIWGPSDATGGGACHRHDQEPRHPPEMLQLLLSLLCAGSLAEDGNHWVTVQRSIMVQEGQCVFVPCTVTYRRHHWTDSTPAHGYWFQEGANEFQDPPVATNNQDRKVQTKKQGRFHLLGDPRNYSCSLDIRDAQRRDTGTYFFRIERGYYETYSYKKNQLYVHVTALSQTPDIHFQGFLESGHPKNITCALPWACERGTPPEFYWIGGNFTILVSRTFNSSVVTLTPGPEDHGTNLTCQVTFPGAGVSTERTIQLTVYAPQNLTVHVFRGNSTVPEVLGNATSLQVQEGQSLRLVCETDGNPPGRLSWWRGSLTVSPSKPLDPGVLELPQVVVADAGEFTCRAQHPRISYHFSLNLVVQDTPVETTLQGETELHPPGGAEVWAPGLRQVDEDPSNHCVLTPHRHSFVEQGGLRAGVVLVAITEAAVKTLVLLLCLVILIVRICMRKSSRTAENVEDENIIPGWPRRPPDCGSRDMCTTSKV